MDEKKMSDTAKVVPVVDEKRPSNTAKVKSAGVKKKVVPELVVNEDKMSTDERSIYNRVIASSDEWKDAVSTEEIADFSLANDPFKFPPPCFPLMERHEFMFRWITRDPKRLDEVMNKSKIMRWYPVNSTSPTSDFVSFIDRNNGAVCREDQMLVFKRYDVFQIEQKAKRGVADTSRQTNDPRNKGGDFSASVRKSTSSRSAREEVKGDDIPFTGEAEIDGEMGIFTPNVSNEDLTANERIE